MKFVPKLLSLLLLTASLAFAQGKAQGTYTITVNPALAITTTSLPAGVVGQSYSAQVAASGGVAPYTFQLLTVAPFGACGTGPFGPLPAGLTMSTSGAITGTPTGTGTFPLCVQVTDSYGATKQMKLSPTGSMVSPTKLPSLRHAGWLHKLRLNTVRALEVAAGVTIFAVLIYAKG